MWVVAGVVTALSSCSGLHDEIGFCGLSPYSPGPSCEVSNWTVVGLGVSSSCASCLIGQLSAVSYDGGDYCCAFWSCFCNCAVEDEGCYQGCQSDIDADCAMAWAQIWYEAQHRCYAGVEGMQSALGCEGECAGQQLAVSLSDLTKVEARLGGAQMFTPVPCQNEDGGSINLVLDSGQDSVSRDSRADTSEHDSSLADSRADGAGRDALADSTSTEAEGSASTDANSDAPLVDAAGDSD